MNNYFNTHTLTGTTASRAAQASLMRSVYLWMTLALVITGLTSMYVAKSMTLINLMMQNSLLFWGLMLAEIGVVVYLTARIRHLAFSTATLLFILYSILNGVTLSVVFLIYTFSSIATTFFITACTFGSARRKSSRTASSISR